MSSQFVKVCSEEDDQIMELPLESDLTLLLSTISTLFPGATGLKYKSNEGDTFRGLRLCNGRLYPPPDGGWDGHIFFCAFPKDNKRKVDDCSLASSIQHKKVDRKCCTDIIVLGMAWKTTEATMREYFSRFGELAMVQLKCDPTTKQSKGYGFIRFVDYGAQVSCLSERHYIDGRWCEVKIPNSKLEGDRQEVSRKIYVGGLAEGVTTEALRDFFSNYGVVSDVFVPKPFRNFAFVTFTDPEVAQSLLGKQLSFGHNILNIGSASPKIPQSMRHNNQQVTQNGLNQMQHYPGNQTSIDQNATTLAALSMLNNPTLFSALMNLASRSTNPPTRGGGNTPQGLPFMGGTSGHPHTGTAYGTNTNGDFYRNTGRYT